MKLETLVLISGTFVYQVKASDIFNKGISTITQYKGGYLMFRKKSIKKIIAIFMTIALYVNILPNITLHAANSTLNVNSNSDSVQRGGNFVITVGISSDKAIKSGEFNFNYDSNAFDCISCESAKAGITANYPNPIPSGSTIRFESASNINNDSSNVNVLKLTLKAKANAENKGYSGALEPGEFKDVTGSSVQFTGITYNVSVSLSGNTNIKSVFVGDQDITSTLIRNFENGIAYAQIRVSPEDSQAKVEFITAPNANGNFNFIVGRNIVQFVVTAPNGAKKTYEITVNRSAPGVSPVTPTLNPIITSDPITNTPSGNSTNSPSPSGSAAKFNSSSPSNTDKRTDDGIRPGAALLWILVALVVGIWIGIFIGYLGWGRKRSTRLFRY